MQYRVQQPCRCLFYPVAHVQHQPYNEHMDNNTALLLFDEAKIMAEAQGLTGKRADHIQCPECGKKHKMSVEYGGMFWANNNICVELREELLLRLDEEI